MIRPLKIFLFLILTGLVLLPAVLFFPEDGFPFGPFRLKMLTSEKILGKDSVHHADISQILVSAAELDSIPMTETLDSTLNTEIRIPTVDELNQNVHRIEYLPSGKENLRHFFTHLIEGQSTNQLIRILHYGDSQIEGDRITSYIREKLQSRFGGSGPGLLPAVQPYESYFSVIQSNTGQWSRYTTFGRKDPRVLHNKYGALAAFSRFSSLQKDSTNRNDSIIYKASITFKESKQAYSGVRKFKKLTIFYGNSSSKVGISILANGQKIAEDSLSKTADVQAFSYIFKQYVQEVTIEFSGFNSPDIYGVDLSDVAGLNVDNIGMRGSSGTFFNTINFAQLSKMYSLLNVRMFILQFGGNVMPYINDSAAVRNYGRWFGSQLNTLKKLVPDAAILVVGPSDMSYKKGEDYLTYPYLPYVRDELKKATLNNGYSYWDMYEAMGGYNSMPEWVKANPPLAGSDYTHFTPSGARLVANMIYNALMIEVAETQQEIKTQKKN